MLSYRLTRRGFKVLGLVLLSSIGLLTYIHWHDILRIYVGLPQPPLYEKVRAKEQSLPHYREYERKNIKYLYAANHFHSSGWGNVMQDFVMTALLTHATNRSFVFNDYVWNPDGSRYSKYNGKLIPSRIPLSALLGGPIVGGPWPPGDDTPLSVSKEFFHNVCPNSTILQVADVNTHEIHLDDNSPAADIFDKWVEKINSMEDPCITLDPHSNPIFDIWIFGQKQRLLSIWPYLATSPVATYWGWSPLVLDAYKRNHHLFEPTKTTFLEWLFNPQEAITVGPIPGLLVVHVRRGDFEDHCVHLSKWSSDWNAFNSLPEFRDKFDPPTDGGWGETSEENTKLYMKRCYPSIEQIVAKVRQVRTDAADPLRYLYIMTNGAAEWVEELRSALAQDMGWDHVGSSRDLKLTWEQKFVAQALDMYVAQWAEVFIGNGWSSLTSNVVMLRMAQGVAPDTNRFW